MKSILSYIFIILVLVLSILGLVFSLKNNPIEKGTASIVSPKVQRNEENEEERIVKVFAVGDVMLDRGVEVKILNPGKGDFKFPFLNIKDYLNEADILFGNLEGSVSERGVRVGSIYSFRMNPKVFDGINYAGFDIFSLANNHMFDYTRIALEDTMNYLKENDIDYVGAGFNEEEAFSLKVKEVNGTKIGFLAYLGLGPPSWRSYNNNSGMAWVSQEEIGLLSKEIEKASQEVDILFVSLHAGIEYSQEPSDFQKEFARMCIDSGADVFLGHHPHVVQRVEEYNDGWIAYSLGNFVFDQYFSKETMEGMILEIVIINDKIENVTERKTIINEDFQVGLHN